jgi:NTP pyrophosphatase (non-canonical NTP hydrolase)
MESLKKGLESFTKERDWDKYHSPKNLAMALSVEASELAEIFMWLTEEESKNLPKEKLADLQEEIGDVMIYLTNLASKFGLDPLDCAKQKLELNKAKYPAHLVKGSAKKYTEYNK